ncbi:MAG: molybdopterin biosynthesis protein [Dehalococcoidia bacterium]|nr:molybdopterin biosynthesis protein [Dehalococcoidia bacterium]
MNKHLHKNHSRYYLEDIPLQEALEKFFAELEHSFCLRTSASENISLHNALGRTTGAPVWSKLSAPHYHAAAMDGIAVHADDTRGATKSNHVELTIGDQAIWLNTGDPIPQGKNAVIMTEVVDQTDPARVKIMSAVPPWNHVRPMGEDIVSGELILPESHVIRAQDLAALAASGLSKLRVRKKPKIAIIPTGSELVKIGTTPHEGQIIEFNSVMLSAYIREWGASPKILAPVADDIDAIKLSVTNALKVHDVVLVNAGSSAGLKDFTAPVIEKLGKVIVHGVAIRPGHPVVLGVASSKPVVGIPGYPVSAVLALELFVKPIISRKLGIEFNPPAQTTATLTRKVLSSTGDDEFLRLKVGRVGKKLVATPIQRGAGVTTSLIEADGITIVPRFSEGFEAGSKIQVNLFRTMEEINNTTVILGSHDLTIDLLANLMKRHYPRYNISSANVGSLGGIMALKRGEAHIAGAHLLDEETGEYNLSYIQQFLPSTPILVIGLVRRIQGLIVKKSNPKNIRHFMDLIRPDVLFVNRQRGSGTRMLLDFELKKLNISSNQINGYSREQYTHLSVAADVASGIADVGLGILAASKALDLDFIPIGEEQYDLIIPKEFYSLPNIQALLSVMAHSDFATSIIRYGGYTCNKPGQILNELPIR